MEQASRSFTFATRFLPEDSREPTYALYGMFRTLDDLVDGCDAGAVSREDARVELAGWREWFEEGCKGERAEAIVPAVRETLEVHGVPRELFLDLISALEGDLEGRRYETLEDLVTYCYGVASTVGLAMCRVLGAPEASHPRAAEVGVAMQLTNILRDVGEDLELGRMYLPAAMLQQYGVTVDELRAGKVTEEYRALIRDLSGVADSYYASGCRGIGMLPGGVRRGIRLAALFYQEILREVERNGYDNLTRRASTSGKRKMRLGLRTLLPMGPPRTGDLAAGLPDGAAIIAGRPGSALSKTG
jgi:15-cis-phytoene synthase